MSKISKIRLNNVTYVIDDPDNNISNIPVATNTSIGGILSGGDITISDTGIVTVNKSISATRLNDSTIGDQNTPVYFENGTPKSCTYSLLADANADDKTYGRKNNEWVELNIPDVSIFVTKTYVDETFQQKLISGINIKTINDESILGEGNINISGGQGIVYDANNVMFTTDLVITSDVGVHTIDSTGSKTLPTNGKSVKQVMDLLFAEEKMPSIIQPSITISSSQIKSYEAGTNVSVSYNCNLNPGKYQYGPDTSVTAISWTVTDSNSNSLDTITGTFPEIQITDNIDYRLTAVCEHTAGSIPVSNLGNEYLDGKIISGSKTASTSKITSYRNSFYGSFEDKDELTSVKLRTLTKSNKQLKNGDSFEVNIPVGCLRVVICYPSTLQDVTSITDVNGLGAEIKTSFTMVKMNISGNNDFESIEYKVYYIDFANPIDLQNKYKVII